CLSATKKFEDDFWSDHSSTFVSKGDGANVAMYHSIFTKKCGDDKDGVDARDWNPIEIMNYLGDTYWKPDVEDGKQVYLPRTNVEVSLSPYAFAGEGTEASPYLIQSANDWRGLTRDIYLWRTYDGEYFKLTNDIYLWETVEYEPSTMLGVTEKASFQGIFDGDGHTLTVSYTDNSNEHYCGPFRFINGATIKNLHVAGTIYKEKKKHVGGLVGKAYGTNHIINCRSSVDIQANTDGDGSHGGFLGDLRDGTTNFTSCVFDGKLRGTRTKKWGGFVGWVADGEQANFTNCVFDPEQVNVKDDGNRTFARRNDGDDVSFTSSYYFQTLGSAQGKEACSISADAHVTMTPQGTEEPGISDGVTSYLIFHNYNPCVMYGDVLYSGNGDQVKLNLSLKGEPVEDYSTDHFIASAGTINGSTDPRTLTMPNEDVTISLAPTDLGLCVGDMNDPYLIYTFEQWQQMCSRINNGEYDSYHGGYYSEKYYKLMADITLTETHNSGNSAVMVGISTSDNTKFRGTFDGNGHTITLDITDNSNDDYCAPFRYLKDGTIKNLHVAGTIVKTDEKNAGGLVGKAEGSNTIRNCRSSVDIFFDDEGDCSSGGFVGELRGGSNNSTSFYNCLFDGILRGNEAYCWGGFVGWVADDCWARFNHCLFNPTDINFDINDSDDNSKTFARVHSGGHIVVETCYYKTLIKDAQGSTDASGFGDEQLRFNLGHGWEIVTEVDVAKVVPIMKKYSLSGEGTEASPYLITSTDDWNGLAGNIFLGETYSGEFLQLTDNITVNRMIGTGTTSTAWNQYSFSGTFDGAGNTLTFNYNIGTEGLIAPFRFVDDATIKNLVVDGTIVTANKYAGGIIGRVDGNTALTNCRSSVTINSRFAGEGCHGGLIGLIRSGANVTITGCLFDGKMLSFPLGNGGATTHCGGFVGEAFDAPYSASVSVINSLYAPAELIEGETAVDITCSSTLVHYTNDDQATITNSYYTQPLGTAQGKQARTISGSEYAIVENAGTATEYNVSGITSYGTGIGLTSMVLSEEEEEEVVVLYAGNGDNVSLNLSCMLPEGYEIHGYQTSAGVLEPSEDVYTLTMPNEDVVITANVTLVTVYREIEGYGDGNDCWAFIASPVEGSILPTAVTDLVGTYDSSTGLYDYDLYRFNPLANLEWENYNNATHQDGFNLVNGMGYLYATKETKTLAFTGTFNTGTSKEITDLPAGFNLVGNPFTVDAYVNMPYYTLNSDGSAIVAKDADDDQRIAPCHGVIVEVSESETVTFNTSGEFSVGPSNGSLKIALSQANTRSNAVMDNAIVSFNKGERLGKFYFGTQSANIYIPQGGKEYAIAYSEGQGEMPVNFKAKENGTYTLSISATPHSSLLTPNFKYLHLIDNLTGNDVDLLATPSYTFEAWTTDYASRFKLVFATGDADADDPFAFISNGQLIVNGTGTLQVIDMLGHILLSHEVHSDSCLPTSDFLPSGVYVLRLINGDEVKIQKIVVK
ncbi:MAG: T9SS type A sorting domain-containing protein, partial [Bacteroidales bacterium]|nr:T9SS type A sorting domain-containing protein [Bacteroidales bacterium]